MFLRSGQELGQPYTEGGFLRKYMPGRAGTTTVYPNFCPNLNMFSVLFPPKRSTKTPGPSPDSWSTLEVVKLLR